MIAIRLNPYLQTPFEIGQYIASLVPFLDSSEGEPSASHQYKFAQGPSPFSNQFIHGLVLKIDTTNDCPESIFTAYGEWRILSSSSGSFTGIFKKLKETLKLEEFQPPRDHHSFWSIRQWNNSPLPLPEEAAAYLSYEGANQAWTNFANMKGIISEYKTPPRFTQQSLQLPLQTQNTPPHSPPPSPRNPDRYRNLTSGYLQQCRMDGFMDFD